MLASGSQRLKCCLKLGGVPCLLFCNAGVQSMEGACIPADATCIHHVMCCAQHCCPAPDANWHTKRTDPAYLALGPLLGAAYKACHYTPAYALPVQLDVRAAASLHNGAALLSTAVTAGFICRCSPVRLAFTLIHDQIHLVPFRYQVNLLMRFNYLIARELQQ